MHYLSPIGWYQFEVVWNILKKKMVFNKEKEERFSNICSVIWLEFGLLKLKGTIQRKILSLLFV
jgi:hypothetical protein